MENANRPLPAPERAGSRTTVSPVREQRVASGGLSEEDLRQTRECRATADRESTKAAVELGVVSKEGLRRLLRSGFSPASRWNGSHGYSPELICLGDPLHRFSTAIYKLRTDLLHVKQGVPGPLKITVVGAERGEGRTFLAANLAVAFAQTGAPTSLVDTDMKNGRLHSMFDVDNDNELTAAAREPLGFDRRIEVLEGQRLDVTTPDVPLILQQTMSPAKIKALVTRLARDDEVVIFDTQAWCESADAQLIAAETDITLVVTRLHRGSKTNLASLVEALRRSGKPAMVVPFE